MSFLDGYMRPDYGAMPSITGLQQYIQQGFDAGRAQGQNQQLAQLAEAAYNDTGDQQSQDVSKAIGINPQAGYTLARLTGAQSAQDRQQALLKRYGGTMSAALQAKQRGDNAAAEGLYQSILPEAAALAAKMGRPPPPSSLDAALANPESSAALYSLAQAYGTGLPQPVKGEVLGPGQVIKNPYTNQVMASGPPATAKIVTGADGRQYSISTGPNGTPVASPIPVAGAGTSPQAAGTSALSSLPDETQAYVPKVMAALGGAQPFDQFGQPTPQLLDAVQKVESNGNPNAVSPAGAEGAYQFMPGTAASVGVADPFDPQQARAGAAKYLAQLYQQFGGNAQKAIAAYNAGPGRVAQAGVGAGGAQTQAPEYLTAPRKSQTGAIPAGYQWNADHTKIVPMPGGPEDPASNPFDLTPEAVTNAAWSMIMDGKMPSLGRSKEALRVRAEIMNKVAQIAKEAHVTPADLATQHGRTKALQASLQNLQKQSDVMEKSENTFMNNANVLLSLSDKVSRSGVPAFNKFLLHIKTNYKGDPDAASFLTARNLVAQEYAKIASSATGAAGTSDTAQTHALELINTAQTPEQLRSVVGTLEKDIEGQKRATEQQLLEISGRMQQFGTANQYPGHEPTFGAGQSPQGAPAVGTVEQGYRFKGGDPSNQANWEPVQ